MRTNKPNLPDWLEKHFPDRFQVLSTETKNAIRNLSFKVKKSVVAEKSDTLIQALIVWDQREAELGITTREVEDLFANAADDMQEARALLKRLKAVGFENIATGIHNNIGSVLFFEEPTSQLRRENLLLLEKALADWPVSGQYDKEILFAEPAEYKSYFQEIVPLMIWSQSSGQYQEHIVFRLFCPYSDPFIARDLERDWQFNARSKRFSTYFEQARESASDWAAKHLEASYTLIEPSEYNASEEDPARLIFKFPFVYNEAEGKEAEESVAGYIVVECNIDTNRIETIKQSI